MVVDPSELVDSRVKRDEIPAILDPRFTKRSDLRGDEEVLGVSWQGESKAYPLRILNYHEVVNDRLGATPVLIAYCPLCHSGTGYVRKVQGRELHFGVSGKLYRNDLVLYDQETESLWVEMLGECIQGPLQGTVLERIPVDHVEWGSWKMVFPGSDVLDPPGGFPYETDPYSSYLHSREIKYPRSAIASPGGPHPKEIVLGIELKGEAKAYPVFLLREVMVINDVLGGERIVVAQYEGVYRAWKRPAFEFKVFEGGHMDDPEGEHWERITGKGRKGSLERVPTNLAFWFAWKDLHPETTLFG